MVWHVYEFEKSASSFAGMFSMSEWKDRLLADVGAAAADQVDAELDDAMDAARNAGWQGKCGASRASSFCPMKKNSSSDLPGPARARRYLRYSR
ncbi:hypothetical protein SB778_31745 [Paraburkholderia sp. SIMBA_050]|jgi:hypothetical protein